MKISVAARFVLAQGLGIDAHFKPVLSFNEACRTARDGSLLVARYGRGQVIYTGISFFRQLPEGVPGAIRLFANLLSLGK